MAYAVKETSQDLTAAALDYTSNFAASFDLCMITLNITPSTVSTGPNPSQNPTPNGVQENIQIWKVKTGSTQYSTMIHSGSFNGKLHYTFAPAGTWAFLSGYEVRVVVTNKHQVGTVNVVITVK